MRILEELADAEHQVTFHLPKEFQLSLEKFRGGAILRMRPGGRDALESLIVATQEAFDCRAIQKGESHDR